jgi:hypothetical protein
MGIVRYASNNVPRFDHDPITGESLGLLIEESSTNYLTSTDAVSWTTEPVERTTVANDTTAPDGSNTGIRFGGPTGRTQAYFYNFANSGVASGKTTASWYVKAGTNRFIYIQVIAGSTNNRYAVLFDMDNNAAFVHDHTQGTVSGTSSDQQNVGNGWFRLSVTMNKSQAGDVYALIGLSDDGNDTWAAACLKTISSSPSKYVYIWGPQVEDRPFASSFIPTNGTAVTRAQDTAKITGTNFTDFYNQSEGTIVSEHSIATGVVAGDNTYVYQVDDGSDTNVEFRLLDHNGAHGDVLRAYGFTGGSWNSPAYGSQTSTPDHDSVLKVAVAVKKDDFGVNFFGGTTYTDTSGDINVNMTQLTIGNHRGGTAPLQGHIRQFKYYPKRLPNAQLQGLTQQ